ncbi:hypothetical protein NB640_11845 [Oxalobacter vibrioformis]|uniref:Lipoprotein n=1 Tax=Oxalobacter vibrioformis TaxID=933080 RepID=A0A9E9LYF6_9BURK|nr:hypothetical protein [Oxalobacter vibrioformis]WAW09895.1 hypothetical protein NB640_11845 [Oxalobacter vibrioformis]
MKKYFLPIILLCSIVLSGCVATTKDRVLDSDEESQLQKRSYQTRVFDTADKDKVMRATVSTLQDLGFLVNQANFQLGTITATKMDGYTTKATVNVRQKGQKQMSVRINAQFNNAPVTEPQHYQNFFASLEKSLFLTAHAGE